MILVLFRGAVLPAAVLRGFAFFVVFAWETRVLGFVLAVFAFAVFAFDETLREAFEAALFEFLRGAICLRDLFLLVLFLVAMTQVYHCGLAQFICTADAARSFLNCRQGIGSVLILRLTHIDELGFQGLPLQIETRNGDW